MVTRFHKRREKHHRRMGVALGFVERAEFLQRQGQVLEGLRELQKASFGIVICGCGPELWPEKVQKYFAGDEALKRALFQEPQ
jgi:hypothetical protein